MILANSHGTAVQPAGTPKEPHPDKGSFITEKTQTLDQVCGFSDAQTCPDARELPDNTFGYFFQDAAVPPHTPATTAALDELADAMLDQLPPEEGNSDVPAIITYLGQFIDHDITVNTDKEIGASSVNIEDVAPLDRGQVVSLIANIRTGALDLDSLYGGARVQGAVATSLRGMLRSTANPALMALGTTQDTGGAAGKPVLPRDPNGDLPRMGQFFDAGGPAFERGFLAKVPEALRGLFLIDPKDDTNANPNRARAVIGDARNDENLGVASVHLAFLRLHNAIVQDAEAFGGPTDDPDALFNWARDRMRWIYQWLIVNVYLPAICDADVLAEVIENEAPVYDAFLRANRPDGADLMPLPLEFSVAAFRFGHTTARTDYDWNRHFGRSDGVGQTLLERANFNFMFGFTGDGNMRPPAPPGQENPVPPGDKLPGNWIVDMERFLNAGEPVDDRNTRLVDTHLAPPLHDMINVGPPEAAAAIHERIVNTMKVLPRRNLRRGQRLNIPTGQACLDAMAVQGITLPTLTEGDLASGTTGAIARKHGFDTDTPLWFYVLKEAEMLGGGLRLGPLGSRIVAEVLVGLIIHGHDTYWARQGSDGGRWHPRDDVKPAGHEVNSLAGFMRAAGLMEA